MATILQVGSEEEVAPARRELGVLIAAQANGDFRSFTLARFPAGLPIQVAAVRRGWDLWGVIARDNVGHVFGYIVVDRDAYLERSGPIEVREWSERDAELLGQVMPRRRPGA